MKNVFKKIGTKKIQNANNTIDIIQMRELILRVTENELYADKFVFVQMQENDLDKYAMYDSDDKIVIEATSGVAAAVAFNLYLREYCHSYVGPITRNINLPKIPPKIGKYIKNESVFLFRYFLNYCTFSYSLLFATWEEWDKITDWMLLSGINLYLNIIGHEIVWRDTLIELGYTEKEALDYICGPAYLPWQWMGNMTHFGGNLPEWWFDNQKELSNKINEKMRSFGAEPILPGYFGIVPKDYKEKQADSHPIDQGIWVRTFEQPSIILSEGEAFDKIAESFYKNTKKHFGSINYFSGDPFHEGGNSDGFNFDSYANKVINEMKRYSEKGIWFLQGWADNPKREMLERMDKEDVIVINLSSDKKMEESDNYNGYPWIYSVTPNFGGTRKMDGNLKGFMLEPFDAIENENITTVGIGMTMEAIEVDEILFEGLSYNAIRDSKPDLDIFLKAYATARYGIYNASIEEIFRILLEEIYILNEKGDYSGRESGLCCMPGLDAKVVSQSSLAYSVDYDEKKLEKCKELMVANLDKLKENECFRFDLMEMSREINANISWHLMESFIDAFKKRDYITFKSKSKEFLNLYNVQNDLMSQNSKTRLDSFINHARAYGRNEEEKNMFAFNAINMIMLWARNDFPKVLIDYAYREWHGIIPYYKKRWQAYIALMDMHFGNQEGLPTINWMDYSFVEEIEMMNTVDSNLL